MRKVQDACHLPRVQLHFVQRLVFCPREHRGRAWRHCRGEREVERFVTVSNRRRVVLAGTQCVQGVLRGLWRGWRGRAGDRPHDGHPDGELLLSQQHVLPAADRFARRLDEGRTGAQVRQGACKRRHCDRSHHRRQALCHQCSLLCAGTRNRLLGRNLEDYPVRGVAHDFGFLFRVQGAEHNQEYIFVAGGVDQPERPGARRDRRGDNGSRAWRRHFNNQAADIGPLSGRRG